MYSLMRVEKRNGNLEDVSFDKILKRIQLLCIGEEFNKKWNLIKNQGFDLTFKRMWEFYLSYCEAGFKSKNIDLIQFSLQNK